MDTKAGFKVDPEVLEVNLDLDLTSDGLDAGEVDGISVGGVGMEGSTWHP